VPGSRATASQPFALLLALVSLVWLAVACVPTAVPLRVAFACDGSGCAPVAAPPGAVAGGGLFRSGAIDLTGDGVADDVRLEGGRIAVTASDGSAWQSQAEWDVVDVALGDPNDDGRGEMMVAFWKRDAAGVLRSQPFVVGYRGGLYRPLWGGSPVEDPIAELELADVDGDGAQDLVVLDAGGADGQLTVSVWHWHGWGFTRVWRSEPGKYHDLMMLPGTQSGAVIVVMAGDAAVPATR
jgi:hypothetical protein